jgi:hypothetical protein
MGLFQLPTRPPGQEGLLPAMKFLVSTDNGTTIQQPGYLSYSSLEGFAIGLGDVLQILYNYNPSNGAGTTGFYFVNFVNGLVLLDRLISNLVWYDLSLGFAQLADATKAIFQYSVPGQHFLVRDLRVSFSPGLAGGDRLLSLTDGTTVYNGTGITAALLETPVNTLWGGTGNPLPAGTTTFASNTAAGSSLYFQYTGGTTDYTSGSVLVDVLIERTA